MLWIIYIGILKLAMNSTIKITSYKHILSYLLNNIFLKLIWQFCVIFNVLLSIIKKTFLVTKFYNYLGTYSSKEIF